VRVSAAARRGQTARPRIALFQANWDLQVHTTSVATFLVARGYDVDLFLYNVARDFENIHDRADSRLRVFDFAAVDGGGLAPSDDRGFAVADRLKDAIRARPGLRRVIRRLRHTPRTAVDIADYLLRRNDLDFVLPPDLLARSERQVRDSAYVCAIGVECEGLLWAGAIAERTGIPCVYYSLELYTNDSPLFSGRRFRRKKRLERQYHRRCVATIVQDEARARALFTDTGALPSTVHLVPVSIVGPPVPRKTRYLHDRLGLPAGTRVLLSLGHLHSLSDPEGLVRAAQRLPDPWVCVIHGHAYGDQSLLRRMAGANTRGRVHLSTALVPTAEITDLVASADIGFIPYIDRTVNEALTGRASEKAARYAQAGVPMIAFASTSFPSVFSEYACGRCIDRVDDLPQAVQQLAAEYDSCRAEAFRAYANVYEFTRHFSRVVDWIDALSGRSLHGPATASRPSPSVGA
jgi:hypothetical protein